jgi:SH3-like domain-containing protein
LNKGCVAALIDIQLLITLEDDLKTVIRICCVAFILIYALLYSPAPALAEDMYGTVRGDLVNLRERPTAHSESLMRLKKGSRVSIIKKEGDWYLIDIDRQGYVRSDYITVEKAVVAGGAVSPAVSIGVVTNEGVKLRAENSTSSDIIISMSKGTQLSISAKYDTWYKVKYGKYTGYVSSVYVRLQNGAKIENDTALDGIEMLRFGMKGSAVSDLQSRLEKLGYFNYSITGEFGAITRDAVQAFQKRNGLEIDGLAGPLTRMALESPDAKAAEPPVAPSVSGEVSGAELVNWTAADNLFPRYTVVEAIDVKTGIKYNLRRFGGSSHADVEPLTKSDTSALLETFGGQWRTRNRRPIWLRIDGRYIAASIMGWPHGVDTLPNNGMNGQVCLHFYGSSMHSPSKECPLHQAAVLEAYEAGR